VVEPELRGEPKALPDIGMKMTCAYRSLPMFAAATGLGPEELFALGRRHVDRRARVLTVMQTLSEGEIVELAKTDGSRRPVPLSAEHSTRSKPPPRASTRRSCSPRR
jgi:integrase